MKKLIKNNRSKYVTRASIAGEQATSPKKVKPRKAGERKYVIDSDWHITSGKKR